MSFLYQRSCPFNLDICLFRENEHPDFLSEHPGSFDTEVDGIVKPSTNIWNILQFSRPHISNLTAHICSKYINKSLFTDERTRKTASVANSIPSKCLNLL